MPTRPPRDAVRPGQRLLRRPPRPGSGGDQPAAGGGSASWLAPALIGALAALLTTFVTAFLQHAKDTVEDRREVMRLRADILKAASDSKSLPVAGMLLDHVLTPIDHSGDLQQFSAKVRDYIATLAAQTSSGSAGRQELGQAAPPTSGDEASLIAKLSGPERLSASNALVELARQRKDSVVGALIGAILPPEKKEAYRVNLYIVFTLARLPGGWHGTPAQADAVRRLEHGAFGDDPTFKARLGEALAALHP